MQKKLTAIHFSEAERTLVWISFSNRAPKKLSGKIKQMVKWLNPKNWFSSLANIEITLEEFACKKFVPEEENLQQSDDKHPQMPV